MRTACFIPIKKNSERINGKNMRPLNGKPLYHYIMEHVKEAAVFDEVFIDTDSPEIIEYANNMRFHVIQRLPELATNDANGNDLLMHHYTQYNEYDYYFQCFATAPYLKAESIKRCYEQLVESNQYDSVFTAVKDNGFYWFNGIPFNYRPNILPRSQDLCPVLQETTGLYGITREALEKYRCRIGKTPYIYLCNKFEAVDINTEEDWKLAEIIGKLAFGY